MVNATDRPTEGAPGQLPGPVGPADRHEIIDIARGFALFGVLLANMVQTTQEMAITDELRAAMPTHALDEFGAFLAGTLVNGKFFTIFSMLFGLGFAVQLSRASVRGVDVLPTYTRRLAVLFLIGLAHATFLWFGDVLHIYALLGFVLILFRDRSDRVVLSAGAGLLLAIMGVPLVEWACEARGWEDTWLLGRPIPPAELHEALRHGSYAAVVRANWLVHLEDYGRIGFGNILVWYLDILAKFLLGFYLGRRMLLQHAGEHLALFRRVAPWALALGLAGNLYTRLAWHFGILRPESPAAREALNGLVEVWILLLSVGYVCTLVLLHERPRCRRALACLAPVGRMALTNYLTHSVCFVVLFYGVGFGLLGRVGTAGCILLSVVIFAAQILLSAWWLKRYRFGPVEWAWRSLTYAKPQPFRVPRSAPAA